MATKWRWCIIVLLTIGLAAVWLPWPWRNPEPTHIPAEIPKRASVSVYYDNGELETEFETVNGVLDGVYLRYWPDRHTDGERAGKQRVALAGDYMNGKRHGAWVYFSRYGEPELFRLYRDGSIVYEALVLPDDDHEPGHRHSHEGPHDGR